MRNLKAKVDNNDKISSKLYLKAPVSSCHDLCKYGIKHDSVLAKRSERVPKHLSTSEISGEEYSPKRLGTAKVRPKREKYRLETEFKEQENISCDSGYNDIMRLQHSDTSSDLFECMSEESVNMKSKTPSPFLKTILTSEQNNSFLEDGSLEESTVTVPEASSFEEIISANGVPWAWSGGSSDESVVMELPSPPEQENIACIQISHSTEQESSVEFGVTLQKIILPASGNEAKESSNGYGNLKQETAGTLWKNMKSPMAGSSKEQKQVTVLKVDEKRKGELPMLRSSLPVRTSLLGRIEAKKKVVVVEAGILNEKSTTFERGVKSVKTKQAGAIKGPGTSLSPVMIKKKTMAPTKDIQLSPKPAVLPKTKYHMVKYKSPMVVSGGITAQSNKTASKLGGETALKQLGASQVPKSTLYCSPALTYRKLRSVQNQLDAEKRDGMEEKIVHVVQQKVTGVSLKYAEQNHRNPRPQQPSRALSFRSSTTSSILASSSAKEENNGSQMTISNGSGSKKTQIDVGKWRTPPYNYKRIQRRTANVLLEGKSLSPDKLSSITSSSMSSLSPSALLSSSFKEDDDGSKLIISNVRGSKKTQDGVAKGRTPFYNYKIIQKKTKNVSLEDKSLSPEKMSFRRGKEVSLLEENSDEIRVRFIKKEAASEAQNFEDEIGKISLKNVREATTANSATPCPESPIVLKHQDIQGSNTLSLYNDVIEETANKLVEIRKSKVKALVGAFENIISLQEKKV